MCIRRASSTAQEQSWLDKTWWPGVWMYQLTDKGLALELTGKGTKYYKDDDLN